MRVFHRGQFNDPPPPFLNYNNENSQLQKKGKQKKGNTSAIRWNTYGQTVRKLTAGTALAINDMLKKTRDHLNH